MLPVVHLMGLSCLFTKTGFMYFFTMGIKLSWILQIFEGALGRLLEGVSPLHSN